MELSPNFSLEEMIQSNTAARKGIDNTPSEAVKANLKNLCVNFLEVLRAKLAEKYGKVMPIIVSSGYRSPALNKAVGGSANSQHITGQAADIIVPGLTVEELFQFILTNMSFDQCIQEFDSWVHVSYINRNEALRAIKDTNGKVKYLKA